jgi:RecB family exonuclease
MPYIRSRNLYDPKSKNSFKLSRSKIELYLRCPRCFYIDRRLGIGQPKGPSFTLNTAVDTLLKKEFDIHRVNGTKHPLCDHYSIDAIPYAHESLDQWRENFVGVQYLHEPTNLLITGAIDDVWQTPSGQLIVVDYKATSTLKEISLDDEWKQSYKRQMEIYQWLLRKNGFDVSDTGYFVYCNGLSDKKAFDGKLEFDIQLIPYEGSSDWIEGALDGIQACLSSDHIPECLDFCDHCQYYLAMKELSK